MSIIEEIKRDYEYFVPHDDERDLPSCTCGLDRIREIVK